MGKRSAAASILFWALAGEAIFGAPPEYPGPAPGSASVRVTGNRLSISNAALALTWRFETNRLRLETVVDTLTGQRISCTGEVFRVLHTNGQALALADLKPAWPPTIRSLPPHARYPGTEVSVLFGGPNTAAQARWRVMVTDGANYVRQELALISNRDLFIDEIQWMREVVPGALQHGEVDGSLVGTGPFFFGIEDPNALNQAPKDRREIGRWQTEDITPGHRRQKRWRLPEGSLAQGNNIAVFEYRSGSARLDIWKVHLLEDGAEVASDAHHGWTGTSQSGQAYLLPVSRLKPGAAYELAAEIGTDPAWQPAPGQEWDSSGRITVERPGGLLFCRSPRGSVLAEGKTLVQSFVIGVTPRGQLRRGFLHYNERERAHPFRPYLHYNSWYDISWKPFELNEANCLEAIRAIGEELIRARAVRLDGLLFDDGWDDPKSLWRFHSGFPRGFAPHAALCRGYNTRLAVWLSPFGGYGTPRDLRLAFGRSQGYETNSAGFSLAGPRYYEAFKSACLRMIREYGVNHFKFDGIAAGMYASGAAQYRLDTESMCRLIAELRQAEPELFVNLTTGSWPSPFWLRHADSVWRQGDDMGFAGPGTKQQQWITYRDRETFRNIVRRGPLYPLNSLMNQGIAYSRQGTAGDPAFNSAGFKEDVRSFFGTGTGTQELYIQPGRLAPADWDVLAEAARWSRANREVFVDTHWIGGDPGALQVYGYASWSTRKGIFMLRNPAPERQVCSFDAGAVFELPAEAPTRFRLTCPWAGESNKTWPDVQAGTPLQLVLEPFQILVLEAHPQ